MSSSVENILWMIQVILKKVDRNGCVEDVPTKY